MNLFSGNIRRRVMASVEQRIADGQKEFDEESKREDEHLAEGVRALTIACSKNKLDAETRIVGSIIG